jgi:hypothetical protein
MSWDEFRVVGYVLVHLEAFGCLSHRSTTFERALELPEESQEYATAHTQFFNPEMDFSGNLSRGFKLRSFVNGYMSQRSEPVCDFWRSPAELSFAASS